MRIKVKNIDYGISYEDVADIAAMDLYGQNYDYKETYGSDFFDKCDEIIEKYEETLPSEMELEINGNGDIEEEISDKISDKTGFIAYCFDYEEILR